MCEFMQRELGFMPSGLRSKCSGADSCGGPLTGAFPIECSERNAISKPPPSVNEGFAQSWEPLCLLVLSFPFLQTEKN